MRFTGFYRIIIVKRQVWHGFKALLVALRNGMSLFYMFMYYKIAGLLTLFAIPSLSIAKNL